MTPYGVRKPRRFGYWKRLADGSRPSATLRSAFAARLLCLMNNACCLPLGIYSTLRGLMRGGHGGGRRFLCRLRRSSYGIIGDFPTDNAGQTTLQKAGRSGCGGACAAGGSVGKVPDNFSSHAGSEGDTLECDHRLTQHGTAGMPHVDADACHEAVDFLRDFEKTNRAEKPDQDISRTASRLELLTAASTSLSSRANAGTAKVSASKRTVPSSGMIL